MNARNFLFLLTSLLLGGLCIADERIVKIDPQAKFLTAEQNGILKLYRIAESTEVTVNGAKSTFQQLTPGQTAVFKVIGASTVVRIAASGIGKTSGSSTPLMLHSVTVQIRVDGTDRVYYQDGKLWIEHLAAQKPTAIVVNGIEWSPSWNGDKSDVFTNFTVPVAPIGQGHVAFKQFAGRGKAKLEHSTAAPAMVNIEDGRPGADDYEFQISW